MISYSSLGEFREASVTGEVSRRFPEFPLSNLPLPFVYSRPSHPTEGSFSMHRTLITEQSIWFSFSQFYIVFQGELLGNDVIN